MCIAPINTLRGLSKKMIALTESVIVSRVAKAIIGALALLIGLAGTAGYLYFAIGLVIKELRYILVLIPLTLAALTFFFFPISYGVLMLKTAIMVKEGRSPSNNVSESDL